VLCCGVVYGADSFIIRSGAATTSRTEVRYYLTGPFGGYGSFVPNPDKDGAYRVPLEQEGRRANSLKAILYAGGCQFTILSLDLKTNPTRSMTFECRQLSTIPLNGRILPPPSHPGALDVEVRYLSLWDHKFFGILNGPVESFSVGKAPLIAGGRFRLEIPDFSKDVVTRQMQDASLQVLVIEYSTSNLVEEVLPQLELRYQNTGLRIWSTLPRSHLRGDESKYALPFSHLDGLTALGWCYWRSAIVEWRISDQSGPFSGNAVYQRVNRLAGKRPTIFCGTPGVTKNV